MLAVAAAFAGSLVSPDCPASTQMHTITTEVNARLCTIVMSNHSSCSVVLGAGTVLSSVYATPTPTERGKEDRMPLSLLICKADR